MTELYSRQQPMEIYIPDYVAVFGVGGIGTWVAIALAMSGVARLDMWDDDYIELSNLARLPYAISDVKKLKTKALADFIYTIRPDIILTTYGKATAYVLSILPNNAHVAFDCTDNSESQKVISQWCRRGGTQYIKAGCDGLNLSVTSHPSGWDDPEAPPGYTITPSWVVPVMLSAGFAVLKACKLPDVEIHGNLETVVLSD